MFAKRKNNRIIHKKKKIGELNLYQVHNYGKIKENVDKTEKIVFFKIWQIKRKFTFHSCQTFKEFDIIFSI